MEISECNEDRSLLMSASHACDDGPYPLTNCELLRLTPCNGVMYENEESGIDKDIGGNGEDGGDSSHGGS